jgi:hypothetical protein
LRRWIDFNPELHQTLTRLGHSNALTLERE